MSLSFQFEFKICLELLENDDQKGMALKFFKFLRHLGAISEVYFLLRLY